MMATLTQLEFFVSDNRVSTLDLYILLVTCFITLCKTTEPWEELAEGKREIGCKKMWADAL